LAWSTYLNGMQYDYDEFRREFDRIADHVRAQMAAGVPALNCWTIASSCGVHDAFGGDRHALYKACRGRATAS